MISLCFICYAISLIAAFKIFLHNIRSTLYYRLEVIFLSCVVMKKSHEYPLCMHITFSCF